MQDTVEIDPAFELGWFEGLIRTAHGEALDAMLFSANAGKHTERLEKMLRYDEQRALCAKAYAERNQCDECGGDGLVGCDTGDGDLECPSCRGTGTKRPE